MQQVEKDIFEEVETIVQKTSSAEELKFIFTDTAKMWGKNKSERLYKTMIFKNNELYILYSPSTIFVLKMFGHVKSFKTNHGNC